jgi:hypothetical protein
MELIVVFNLGMDAAKAGLPRVAPETIEYPIISQYHPTRIETVKLDDYGKRRWVNGWDAETYVSNRH